MRKKIIIGLIGCSTVLIISLGCITYGVYYLAGKFFDAQGQALYSGLGAWTRILEYAEKTGKPEYIKEAQKNVSMLKEEVQGWQETVSIFGLDLAKYKTAQQKAYQTTDNNIKNGMNPLAYLDYIESVESSMKMHKKLDVTKEKNID